MRMNEVRRWMRSTIMSVGLIALAAQAGQILMPEQSEITFVGKQMGVPATGKFQKFTADATLNPATIDQGQVRVVIDMNSVTLPASDLTAEVKRKRWLDTEHFPEATFESKQFRLLPDGRYEVAGVLKLKGVTQDITSPLTLKQQGQDLIAEGQFEIKRLEFNVGDGQWADTDTVANEVQIKFKLRLQPPS